MASPWERQEDETPKAFAAFCAYRDMGRERSIEKLRENSGKTQGYSRHLLAWSSRYSWPARAAAWDEELDRARRVATVESERKDALQKHLADTVKIAQELKSLGIEMITLARRSIRAYSQLPPESVQPTEAASLSRAGMAATQLGLDAEAHALGVESAIQQVTGEGNA